MQFLCWEIDNIRDRRIYSELYMDRLFMWKVNLVILIIARWELIEYCILGWASHVIMFAAI